MKRIVVTGASSFIGTYLIQKLLEDKETEIYAVIRPHSANRNRVPEDARVKIVELDMAEVDKLPSLIGCDVDGFYHLAWNGTRGDSRDDENKQRENYEASLQAAKAAQEMHAKMFLGSGSQAEYGLVSDTVSESDEAKPNTAYGRMKKQTYEALKEYFRDTPVKLYWVRIFSVFGPEDYEGTLIMSSLAKMRKNEKLALTECSQDWDYIYIRDVADALAKFSLAKAEEGIYNVASGKIRPLKDFVLEMKEILHSDSEIAFGAVPYGSAGPVHLRPDVTKIQTQLEWQAKTEFADGIREILEKKWRKS